MAEKKKLVEAITSMETDFARWYTDVVIKAELVDYSSVRGCMIYRPYGYAIWENVQKVFDDMIKSCGHENVYMPLFIPKSLLEREAEHVAGFAPEVAWVTHGGNERLEEKMCVRPTSEVLFCEHYKNIIHSYRDLPKLYNQWCSVVRWEKSTRPFLRSMEFLWQEGHTMHENAQQAVDETLLILDYYAELCESWLAIPVIKGRKSQKEKFAGAEATYTLEAMMHDGRALQSATSHYFGSGFAKTFEITFSDRDNKLATPHQTSWGLSTRIIGAIIMTHGDNNGLVLPPRIAPTQIIVVPIAQHKEGVLEKAEALHKQLAKKFRAKIDSSEYTPGWKFAQHEMRGVPIRVELGPKDIEQGQCVLVRRDTGEKLVVSLDAVDATIENLLVTIQSDMFEKAKKHRAAHSYEAFSYEEMGELIKKENCFIKTMWCEDPECELKVKELSGMTSRCMPLGEEPIGESCAICGKPAGKVMIWGKAY